MSGHIKHFNDLSFSVKATVHSHYVDYAGYYHEGYSPDGTPMFTERGALTHPSPVETMDEAEPYFHGSVKWDGCSNWNFDEQERCMLHGCSKSDIVNLGLILGECWEWTKELLPNFSGDD